MVVQHSALAEALVAVPVSGVEFDALERELIAFALEIAGGNRSQAARFLGLTRSALLYRMNKHRLVASNRRDARAGSES